MMTKCYSDLKRIISFEDRYEYLKLQGVVGSRTFGSDRYLNQLLYSSDKWKKIRNHIIIRDNGCDLGCMDYEIHSKILIHHMNPVMVEDILEKRDWVFDPEFLICTSKYTHLAIHYGDQTLLPQITTDRYPNDTCPWKK